MTRRRGEIRQLGDRKFQVRVFLGVRDGKKKYWLRTVNGPKREADALLAKALRELDTDTFAEPTELTADAFFERWLETVARHKVRPVTLDSYRDALRLHVRPVLGGKRLDRVTSQDVQKAVSAMVDRGLSPATIRRARNVLSAAFKQAVRWRLLQRNPVDDVDVPRQVRREMHAMNLDEARAFLAVTDQGPHAVLFAFALATGMRPGEYLALRWADLDLERGTASVQRSLGRPRKGGGYAFDEPKTASSRRQVPLPAPLVRQLRAQRRTVVAARLRVGEAWRDLDLVFPGPLGEPLHEHNLYARDYKAALAAAGLPSTFRLYDLRHTCATLMLLAGENPKVVAERLGHGDVALTLAVYSHALPGIQREAAERLGAALFDADSRPEKGK